MCQGDAFMDNLMQGCFGHGLSGEGEGVDAAQVAGLLLGRGKKKKKKKINEATLESNHRPCEFPI